MTLTHPKPDETLEQTLTRALANYPGVRVLYVHPNAFMRLWPSDTVYEPGVSLTFGGVRVAADYIVPDRSVGVTS